MSEAGQSAARKLFAATMASNDGEESAVLTANGNEVLGFQSVIFWLLYYWTEKDDLPLEKLLRTCARNACQQRLERLYAQFEGELMVWVIGSPCERSWGFLAQK